MSVSNYFSSSFSEARVKFKSAAQQAGSSLYAYTLKGFTGPDNEELITDVAVMGPEDASNVLLLISGTHGVEGFAGSGCQVGFFIDELYKVLPPDTLTILIHAFLMASLGSVVQMKQMLISTATFKTLPILCLHPKLTRKYMNG